MWCRNRFLGALLALAVCSPAAAQGIVVPNTFTNGTTADADQVNANFAALVNNALNRAGGIMSGSLQTIDVLPVTTDVSDIGTNLKKYRDGWFSRNVSIGGTLTVTGTAATGALTVTGAATISGNSTIGAGAAGTTLGVGATPVRQVHVTGVGQTVPGLTDAGATGGTVFVQAADSVAGSGGAVVFGAGGVTNPFAGFKALFTNGAGNGVGDLVVATRSTTASVTLSEVMRWYVSGGVSIGTPSDPGAQGLAFSGAEILNGNNTFVIGANQNDYHPTNFEKLRVVRIDGGAATRTITGWFPTANQLVTVINAAAQGSGVNLILSNLGTSTANFQMVVKGGASLTLLPGEKVDMFYDQAYSGAVGKWLVN